MLRQSLTLIVATLVTLGLAGVALAQDAPAPHKSTKGYSILAPTGWEVVSGELDPQELEKLPTSVREHYDPKTTDVMFMDLASNTEMNDFKDNLNIVVLDEPVPISDELIADLKEILTEQYKSLFEGFALTVFEKTKFGENDAIKIEATYTLLGYELVLYQALMTGPTKALVITCTMEQSRKEDRVKICSESFSSVSFQ